jgi:hypothetical protein
MKMPLGLLFALLALLLPGCLVASKTELNAAQVQNRALMEQSKAQLAEIENLNAHSRDLEDRVIRDENQLASLRDREEIDKRRIETYEQEREGLYDQFARLAYRDGKRDAADGQPSETRR